MLKLPVIGVYFGVMLNALPTDTDLWVKAVTQAPLAICLVWFMLRLERILKDHTASVNNLIKSQMVSVMTFEGASKTAKDQAKAIIDDIDSNTD